MLFCAGICASAQPFFVALVQKLFPHRPVVVVTGDLKIQENIQQDLETWLVLQSNVGGAAETPSSILDPLFSWDRQAAAASGFFQFRFGALTTMPFLMARVETRA